MISSQCKSSLAIPILARKKKYEERARCTGFLKDQLYELRARYRISEGLRVLTV